MNIFFSIILLYLMVVTVEACMKMIPPDEAYIPSTLAPTAATEEPEEMMTTIAMESTTEKVCEASSDACPKLERMFDATPQIAEIDGCPDITCPENAVPYLVSTFSESEIEPFYPMDSPYPFNVVAPSSISGSVIDYYGIICDAGVWKFTKYPDGIHADHSDSIMGEDGSLTGKKSTVEVITCT